MERSEINKNLKLILADDGERMMKLSEIWKSWAYDRFTLLIDVAAFLQWYYADTEEPCPYSCERICGMANGLIATVTTASGGFIKAHRRDYDVLEIVCRDHVINGLYVVEIVKIMDYIIDNGLV